MKLLVVGSGGREHALAWRLARPDRIEHVFVAPGNAGTALEPKLSNVDIAAADTDALIDFAAANDIALTVIGPEDPLVAGIVDRFSERGLACFGPSAAAARLEGSKAFTKAFLERHAIPTARYASFEAIDPAIEYIRREGAPIVVKADGLAAGKGVIVARDVGEAEAAVRDMLGDKRFGDAGARVVIEEFLEGEEASFIVIADGLTAVPMATSQDHKARDDGDRGPNTGGMGAYSPAPVVDDAMSDRIMASIIRPTLEGLKADGIHYTGFLYAGVMIGSDGVARVLEFNCRFGDPETQPIMARLESDLAAVCLDAVNGTLKGTALSFDAQPAVGIVLAADGYPGAYASGETIAGLDAAEATGAKVFHAGTRLADGRVVSAGGRVLCLVARGNSVREAAASAYEAVAKIDWPGAYYRRDIAWRAIARESR